MGLVTLGPPSELLLKLAERYDVRDFIETAKWLSLFPHQE
jgi:hypothetical protein